MIYHQICNKSNTSDATSGAGTANLSGAPEFTLVFLRIVSLGQIFCFLCSVLLIIFCPFVLFPLTILLPVILQTMVYDYHLGIFKFFLSDLDKN